MKVKAKAFEPISTFSVPSQPAAAEDPAKPWNGANAMQAATFVASALVIATLA